MRYHGRAGGRKGWPKGEIKKKLGGLIFFIVFEYKVDIANNCNNSRRMRIGELSQR